jgi:hypothetical protein
LAISDFFRCKTVTFPSFLTVLKRKKLFIQRSKEESISFYGKDAEISASFYLNIQRVQLALRKRNISYKFEFLRSQYGTWNKKSPLGTLSSISLSRTQHVKSPIKAPRQWLQANCCYAFISWSPVYLKRAIDTKRTMLSIGIIR